MWPDTRGLPSPTMRSRIFDHIPSQPIRARPSAFWPFSNVTVTPLPVSSKLSTRRLVSSVTRLLFWHTFRKVPWMSARGGAGGGPAEALEEVFFERNAHDELAGKRVAHLLRRRPVCVGEHRVLEADFLQHTEDVRPELGAGAHPAT